MAANLANEGQWYGNLVIAGLTSQWQEVLPFLLEMSNIHDKLIGTIVLKIFIKDQNTVREVTLSHSVKSANIKFVRTYDLEKMVKEQYVPIYA